MQHSIKDGHITTTPATCSSKLNQSSTLEFSSRLSQLLNSKALRRTSDSPLPNECFTTTNPQRSEQFRRLPNSVSRSRLFRHTKPNLKRQSESSWTRRTISSNTTGSRLMRTVSNFRVINFQLPTIISTQAHLLIPAMPSARR